MRECRDGEKCSFEKRGREADEISGEEALYMLQESSQWRRHENRSEELPERQVQSMGSVIQLEQKGHALFSVGRKELGMGTGVGRDLRRDGLGNGVK